MDINLGWNSTVNADSYFLEAGRAPDVYDQIYLDVGKNLSSKLQLQAVGTWYVAVFAYNSTGISPPSNEISITFLEWGAPPIVDIIGMKLTIEDPLKSLAYIYGSDDLTTWQAIGNDTPVLEEFQWIDMDAWKHKQRFYLAVGVIE